MKISLKVFYKLIVSFLLVVARHVQSTQNSNFVISLRYLKKKGGMKLVFSKLSYKLVPLILVGIVRPAQITQNNKFAQERSKEWS